MDETTPVGAAVEKNIRDAIIPTEMSNKTKALLAVLVIAIFSGGTAPYIKLALTKIPPFTFTFIRFFLSAMIIIPVFLVKVKPKFKKQDFKLIFLSFLSTVNIILFSFGIKLTMASVGQILYSFTPILVYLISYYSLKEKITSKKIFGVLIGFFGVNLITTVPIFINKSLDQQSIDAFIGNILILIGCIGYSYYTVLSKKYLKTYSPLWITVFFIFTTALVSLFFITLEISQLKSIHFYLNSTILWPVFYVTVIGTVMAYLLQQYAIDKGTPLISSLMQYFYPASTLVWSYFILGEKLTVYIAVGVVFILFGAWIVTKES